MKRMSKKKRNNWIIAGVILAVVIAGVAIYFGVPEVKEAINGLFTSGGEEVVEEVETTVSAFLA